MSRLSCIQQRDIAPPQVFISSTFERLLTEIRDALRSQLELFNYIPLMSELGSFAYGHNKSIADDTIGAVRNSQIYVLVLGRRYGSRHKSRSDRSITELEYEQAMESNLPIYVYIAREVWEGYKAFKSGAISPGGETHWVDEVEVFNFIERLTVRDEMRCHPFDAGSEILDDLRRQIANLFGAYLRFDLKTAKWLWTGTRTWEIERSAKAIWIITPDFAWDWVDPKARSMIFDNIAGRDDVRYCYLYDEGEINNGRVREMSKLLEQKLGPQWSRRVKYVPVEDEAFVWSAEHILYNPYDGATEHAFIITPMEGRDEQAKYNIELTRDRRLEFRGIFQREWNNRVTDRRWKINHK